MILDFMKIANRICMGAGRVVAGWGWGYRSAAAARLNLVAISLLASGIPKARASCGDSEHAAGEKTATSSRVLRR
jgi:hypothetical protein